MPKKPAPEKCRPRNIHWPVPVDEIAVNLAFEKRLKGGVSELLTRLIIAESKRKRGIAHLHEPAIKLSKPSRSRSGAATKARSDKNA